MKKKRLFAGLFSAFALLGMTSFSLTSTAFYYSGYVNSFLGITGEKKDVSNGNNYYPSAYGEMNKENCTKLIADEKAHAIQTMEEGTVLIRNENSTLPLKDSERGITLFGNSVKDPVYRTNAGQASFDDSVGGTIHDAFTNAGFRINETMFEAYQNSSVKRVSSAKAGTSSIGEADSSFYTDQLKASYANDYNDVAVVLFTRYGGEGVDLEANSDADGLPLLVLHQQEKDLLKMIKDSGKFKKTVVLINSPFQMELQWIEEEEYGVDACLVFSATGNYGFIGIANILKGDADPSGHLADTFATNSKSSPAMQNYGDYTFANHSTNFEKNYLVYAEDIYVGYRYYETRYQDQVLGLHNATDSKGAYEGTTWDYAKEMAYPFGYGLSYADFDQKIENFTWDKTTHKVKAEVRITNNSTSSYAGKSKAAVQLYVQAPYSSDTAQKSAIQLIGTAKSSLLGKGESEVVTVEIDDYAFATYDENATNGADTTKQGCYVLDKGDYYFAIGSSSHDALNNILRSKGVNGMFDEKGNSVSGNAAEAVKDSLSETDNKTYAKNPTTGEIVANALQDADLNKHISDAVTYLTREDWRTFPDSIDTLSTTPEMDTLLDGNTYVTPSDSPALDSVVVNTPADLSLVDMKDVSYEDEKWDTFINQLSYKDMATVIGDNRGVAAITTVNKPANASTNGPSGIQGNYTNGTGTPCTLYPDQVVLSCTFNEELAHERGKFFAEDAMYSNITMVFGPGANTHRTPYLGRNSEYYSEDGLLAGLMAHDQAMEMTKKGVITGFKHFAFNDQEVNRHGVATFLTEQSAREIYLKVFEGALTDGSGLGVMTSYNRVGLTSSTQCYGLQTQILRNEWGFKGINITDSAKDASTYVHTAESLIAGTDQFLSDTTRTDALMKLIRTTKDGNLVNHMKLANKHFYYALSRSTLINGLGENVVVEETVYWWQPALITLSIILCVIAALMLVLCFVFGRKEEN